MQCSAVLMFVLGGCSKYQDQLFGVNTHLDDAHIGLGLIKHVLFVSLHEVKCVEN